MTKRVLKIAGGIAALAFIGVTLYGMTQYAKAIGLFDLERIVVSGNAALTDQEVVDLTRVPLGTVLFDLPLDSIQTGIETNPYVLTSQISRQFPRTLFIEIKEREPIAYLNLNGRFLCVDTNTFVMPVPPSRGKGLPLPIFSGFTASDSIVQNTVSSNRDLNRMVKLLTEIHRDYPAFHRQISELIKNGDDEFTVYTSDSATKIYLGQDYLTQKIQLLAAFWHTLGDRKTWNDYDYIDLRYRKQVVVHERT